MPVQTVIKLRRDSAVNWDTVNPVLAAGEMGIESDTGLHKIGDGITAWGVLPYAASSTVTTQVKNSTGSSIPKGSVVYISGAVGGDALVSLADADMESTSSKTLGFTAKAIANDGLGTVIEQGLLSGVNTSAATAGQAVYLSSTAGGFVFGAPPAKPAHSVYLGVVVRVHATEGEILVKVQNGYELDELHDVSITSVAGGQVLQYDAATSLWKNSDVTVSEVTGLQTALDGKAATSHTHTMSSLTDFNISSPTNGQTLTYNSATGKWVNGAAAATGETISSFLLMGA